jgi:N-acetylmuramoyl-L-alanine amidase
MDEGRRIISEEGRVLTFTQKALNEVLKALLERQRYLERKKEFSEASKIRNLRFTLQHNPDAYSIYDIHAKSPEPVRAFSQYCTVNDLEHTYIESDAAKEVNEQQQAPIQGTFIINKYDEEDLYKLHYSFEQEWAKEHDQENMLIFGMDENAKEETEREKLKDAAEEDKHDEDHHKESTSEKDKDKNKNENEKDRDEEPGERLLDGEPENENISSNKEEKEKNGKESSLDNEPEEDEDLERSLDEEPETEKERNAKEGLKEQLKEDEAADHKDEKQTNDLFTPLSADHPEETAAENASESTYQEDAITTNTVEDVTGNNSNDVEESTPSVSDVDTSQKVEQYEEPVNTTATEEPEAAAADEYSFQQGDISNAEQTQEDYTQPENNQSSVEETTVSASNAETSPMSGSEIQSESQESNVNEYSFPQDESTNKQQEIPVESSDTTTTSNTDSVNSSTGTEQYDTASVSYTENTSSEASPVSAQNAAENHSDTRSLSNQETQSVEQNAASYSESTEASYDSYSSKQPEQNNPQNIFEDQPSSNNGAEFVSHANSAYESENTNAFNTPSAETQDESQNRNAAVTATEATAAMGAAYAQETYANPASTVQPKNTFVNETVSSGNGRSQSNQFTTPTEHIESYTPQETASASEVVTPANHTGQPFQNESSQKVSVNETPTQSANAFAENNAVKSNTFTTGNDTYTSKVFTSDADTAQNAFTDKTSVNSFTGNNAFTAPEEKSGAMSSGSQSVNAFEHTGKQETTTFGKPESGSTVNAFTGNGKKNEPFGGSNSSGSTTSANGSPAKAVYSTYTQAADNGLLAGSSAFLAAAGRTDASGAIRKSGIPNTPTAGAHEPVISLDKNTHSAASAKEINHKGIEKATWDLTGAETAIDQEEGSAVHSYHSNVQHTGMGDLGMWVMARSDNSFYKDITDKVTKTLGKDDIDLLNKIYSKDGKDWLKFNSPEENKESLTNLATLYEKTHVITAAGRVQQTAAGQIAKNTQLENLYLSNKGTTWLKINGSKDGISVKDNLVNTLIQDATKAGKDLSKDQAKALADKMLKTSSSVTTGLNHAARTRFNKSNLIIKQALTSSQDNSTVAELRDVSNKIHDINMGVKTGEQIHRYMTERRIQKATKLLGEDKSIMDSMNQARLNAPGQMMKNLDAFTANGKTYSVSDANAFYKKVSKKYEAQQKKLQKLQKSQARTDRLLHKMEYHSPGKGIRTKTRNIQHNVAANVKKRIKSTRARKFANEKIKGLTEAWKKTAIHRGANYSASIAGKVFGKVNVAYEVIQKMIMKLTLFLIKFFAIYVAGAIGLGLIVGIFMMAFLVVFSFFTTEDDAFSPQKVEDATMGKVYLKLERDETEWLKNLVSGKFIDADNPPYVDQLTYTDTTNLANLRDMPVDEYVPSILNMTYDADKGAVKGPTPWPNAPEDAYKWMTLLDGGIAVEFRDREGNYGYTSNIKEITAMTIVANAQADNPDENLDNDEYADKSDLDLDPSDPNSPAASIESIFTSVVNAAQKAWDAVKSGAKMVHNGATHIAAGIPGLGDWWVQHKSDKRAKIYMQYAKPLFDKSHDQAYGLDAIIKPTLWTLNGGNISRNMNDQFGSGESSIDTGLGLKASSGAGNLSGYRIDGTPIELWMLSMAGEMNGSFTRVLGDKGRAYGLMQFDYRHDLVTFMNFAYHRHPDVWSGFKPYLSVPKASASLIGNQNIVRAFDTARTTDYDTFVADQCVFMREVYLAPIANALKSAKGIDLTTRSIAVSGAILSTSVNHGVGGTKTRLLKALNNNMSDMEMMHAVYNARLINLSNKSVRYRYSVSEPKMAEAMMNGTLGVHNSFSYGNVAWKGNYFFKSEESARQHYFSKEDDKKAEDANSGSTTGATGITTSANGTTTSDNTSVAADTKTAAETLKYKDKEAVTMESSWEFADKSTNSAGAARYFIAPENNKNICIAINPAHSGLSEPGDTLANGQSQSSVNMEIANNLKEVLLSNGYDVLMLREDESSQLDNIARQVVANNVADLYIVINGSGLKNKNFKISYALPTVPGNSLFGSHLNDWTTIDTNVGNLILNGIKQYMSVGSGSASLDSTALLYTNIPAAALEAYNLQTDITEKKLQNIADGVYAGIDEYFKNEDPVNREKRMLKNDDADGKVVVNTQNPGSTYTVDAKDMCDSDESQQTPISEHNEHGGYGCMSYSHFSYNDTDPFHLCYNGQIVNEVAPSAVLGEDQHCNAPDAYMFFAALDAHPECWTAEVTSTETGVDGDGPDNTGLSSVIDSTYGGAEYGYTATPEGDGHSWSITITTDRYEDNGSSDDDDDDDPYHDEKTITFTHNCSGNHKGYYCGGHLVLKVTGVITGFTEAERKNDHTQYADKMENNTWKHAPLFGIPIPAEISKAKDLFDIDLAIIHKDGTFNKYFEGWKYDNMDQAANLLMDDWKELYGIPDTQSLDSIVGGLAKKYGTTFVGAVDINALASDGSGKIDQEALKNDPAFAKIVAITEGKYLGPSKSVYSQGGEASLDVFTKGYGRTGAPGPDGRCGLDCSGFVGTVLRDAGIRSDLYGGTTKTEINAGGHINWADMRPGDLIFFGASKGSTVPTHVGIYCGNRIMLDCGGRKGKVDSHGNPIPGTYKQGYVRYTTLSQYYVDRFITAVRVYNHDAIPISTGQAASSTTSE